MPQWSLFFALTLVLTVVLLVLARLSQNAIEEFGPDSSAGSDDSDVVEVLPYHDELPQGPPSGVDDEQGLLERETSESHSDHPSPDEPDEVVLTSRMLMANVALTQGLVVVVLLTAAWYFDIPATAFGVAGDALSTGTPAVMLGIAFGVVLWIANELSTTVADAVGASYDERVRELLAPETTLGWIVLFGGVLPLIAVAEELLFRAALIGVPAAGLDINVWLLAAFSSVAFALGHGAQGRVGIVVTGALGFVLAAGYVVSGSLLLVIVAHYVINALEFFVHEFLGVEDVTVRSLQSLAR